MINPGVIAEAATLRERYAAAKPFRHLCIENFLQPDLAEQALADFPAFDPGKAMNEHRRLGKKSVIENMRSISAFYARLHDHVCGPDFLAAMEQLTGVEGLEADETMYGGGTHDNRDGQELDPHIDFNYDQRVQRHRRMNLLIYLNKDWDPAWGGAIDLHSNPRAPAEDQITSFAPNFNRAVLFETNEHSWHGFRAIALPPDRQHLSRKCISLYFYTKTRPADEIAPPHSTHYIPRPLPEDILTPGRVLSENDVYWIRRIRRERDQWLAFYQSQELRIQAELQEQKVAVAHFKAWIEKSDATQKQMAEELEKLRSELARRD